MRSLIYCGAMTICKSCEDKVAGTRTLLDKIKMRLPYMGR